MSSTPIPAGIPGQSITGGSANDTLRSSAGDDSIDGQGGTDTVVFSAARAAYAIARSGPGWVVSSQQDGTDSLLNIERLQVGIALYCCTAVLLCIAARIFPEQWQGRRGQH